MFARIIFGFGITIVLVAIAMTALQMLVVDEPVPVVASADQPASDASEALEDASEQLADVIDNGVITDLQPDVSEEVAATSANFAEAMRQRTGAVPDLQPDRADPLILTSNARFKDVSDLYYETWSNLLRRCWESVEMSQPFDETGLDIKGDERVDYDTAYTEQKWFSADKAFEVTYKMRGSYAASSGLLRSCSITTNRFALAKSDAVAILKDHYDTWWAEEQLEDASTFVEYPYTIRDGDNYHAALTDFGSVQGCGINVSYRDLEIASERDAFLYIVESDKGGCEAPPR